MKQILLIILGLSAFINAEFTTVGQPSGVVKDTSTLLLWQDDYSANNGNIKLATWTAAIDYCEALGLAGLEWRLPNKKELLSLVDYAQHSPSIDSVFNHTISSSYWLSTTHAYNLSSAWMVDFYDGNTYSGHKSNIHYVRCVR